MSVFLTLAFLFFVGSVSGWLMELIFRRFFSRANPERKWINPGFCTGPYVPLYGFGLCIMFLIVSLEKYNWFHNTFWNKAVLFLVAAALMTGIEYIAGIVCLKIVNVRLWDYSDEWKNIRGIICPRFSLIWALIGAAYYFFIHPHILNALSWLSRNLAFSFVIGLFFGVFIIDAANSAHLVVKLKRFADDNDVIIRYEHLKSHIRSVQDRAAQKPSFLYPFRSDQPINEHLREMREEFESRKRKTKNRSSVNLPHR